MEIFGSTFDDSVFLESRDKVSVALSSYNAKICEAEWFFESASLDTEDPLEKQKVLKFRGDLAFRQKDFQKALDAYSNCLDWVPNNNLTIRRDVLEGMARCCTRLGQKRRALDLADSLSKDASNSCHLTCLFLLQVSIQQHFGAVGAKMAALQQLCVLTPYNPWHWYSLAQTCLQLLETDQSQTCLQLLETDQSQTCLQLLETDQSQTCLQLLETDQSQASESCVVQRGNVTVGQNDGQEEEAGEREEEETEGRDELWLKASVCFIRTRLLLRTLRQQQSSFVLQRSDSALQRTDEALQRLNPKENTLQILTEVMSEDLVPERMREDSQDGESLTALCLKDFNERWWSRILLTGVLQTDGPEPGLLQTDGPEPGLLQTDGPEPGLLQTDGPEPGLLQTDGPEPGLLQTDGPEPQREQEAKP